MTKLPKNTDRPSPSKKSYNAGNQKKEEPFIESALRDKKESNMNKNDREQKVVSKGKRSRKGSHSSSKDSKKIKI